MKVQILSTIVSLSAFLGLSSGLKIIINNDDGWATANIREFYKALRADGHDAYIIAPVDQESGQGGRTVFSTEANLTSPGQFNSVPAGAPSFGSHPSDSHIWYYNGTPAAVTFFALDYLVKTRNIFNGSEPDLLVTGPNEGSNAGPFVFTLSGTVGAAYAAVSRGIPAVAFSAADIVRRAHTAVNASDVNDPAVIVGKLAAKVVKQLEKNAAAEQRGQENDHDKHLHPRRHAHPRKNARLLPYGYGISVNFPYITKPAHHQHHSHNSTSSSSSDHNQEQEKTCTNPPFVHTRLTGGGAATNYAAYNEETKTFAWALNYTSPGVNTCINGDCDLPGETDVIKECKTAVSVWTIDYDAPSCGATVKVRELLDGLVEGKGRSGRGERRHKKDEMENKAKEVSVNSFMAAAVGIFAALSIL